MIFDTKEEAEEMVARLKEDLGCSGKFLYKVYSDEIDGKFLVIIYADKLVN